MPIEIEYVTPPPAGATVEVGPKPPPSIPEAVRDRIAALQRGPSPKVEAPPVAEEPGEEPTPAEAAEGAPAEAAAPDAPPAPEWEAERTEYEALTKRQREAIARLEGELAETRKSTEADITRRARLIEEAEDTYVRSPVAAIRKVLAAVHGVDPDSEKVKEELGDLFLDLTSEITGVASDTAHQAKRVSALTRLEWDRKDKRRAAGEKQTQQPPSEQRALHEQAVTTVRDTFAPIAKQHPHLTALAQQLDGLSVEQVLWDVIDKGVKRGDFAATEKDDVLVAKAAKLAEQHYQARWTKLQSAFPSTATPGVKPAPKQDDTKPAAAPSKTVGATGQRRSLSNADASVAPATTPPQSKKDEKPAFKSDAERQRWATRHLRGE